MRRVLRTLAGVLVAVLATSASPDPAPPEPPLRAIVVTVDTSDLYVLPDQYVEADVDLRVAPARGCDVFGGRCRVTVTWSCLMRDGRLERVRFSDQTFVSSGPTLHHWVNDWHVRGCAQDDVVTPLVTVAARTPLSWASRSAAVRFDDAPLDRYARRLARQVGPGEAWAQPCEGLPHGSTVRRACRDAAAADVPAEQRPWALIAAVLTAGGGTAELEAMLAPRARPAASATPTP